MQVIVERPQDPTDLVLQGAVIGDRPLGGEPPSRYPWFVLQGEITTAAMAEIPVPRAMIGQHDWYGIKPRTIGPKVFCGGECVMLDVGAKPADPFVDPTQRFLNSAFQVDQNGIMLTLYDAKTIGAPEAFAQFMVPEPETMGNPVVQIPRCAVYRSGLAKRTTVPLLPDSFGGHTLVDSFVETTSRFRVAGIARDRYGAVLAGCRVVVLDSAKIARSDDQYANPHVDEAVSDGSGAYSIQVRGPGPYQVIAYKAGAPDVAGITRNDVMAVEYA